MTNAEIADHFSLLAQLMEIDGENPFKVKSYQNAADSIEELPDEIMGMPDAALHEVRGIGQAVADKIHELLKTGKMEALEKLAATIPPGIVEMLRIKGLSAKKVGILWKSLQVEDVEALEAACRDNRVAPLKGFGAKSQGTILDAILFYKHSQGFYRYATAAGFAEEMKTLLQEAYPDNSFAFAGDFRRQMEVLEVVDIVTDLKPAQLEKAFKDLEAAAISDVIDHKILVKVPDHPSLLVHLSPPKDFYKTLFLASGSEDFIAAFLDKYSIPDHPESEEEIFKTNDLNFIPAPMRETVGILEKAAKHKLPKLITAKDIKAIIHAHSTYSDGAESLEAMATGARDRGYEYLVISDHSQVAFYAKGLYPEKIIAQHKEIDALNKKLSPFKIFKSIEADILTDGNLDYNPAILSSFDLVIASVHSNLKMSEEKAMVRLLKAIANPFTTILGHATSRQLLIRDGYPVNHKQLIDACAEHQVVLEINANPRRLDIDWRWIDYALEQGVLLSINPDAHSLPELDYPKYGVLIAQKGGLTAKDNLSSYSLKEFEAFLIQQKNNKLPKQP